MAEFLSIQDKSKMNSWRVRWDALLKESVIIDLDISKWHPFARLDSSRMEKLGVKMGDQDAKSAFNEVMRSGSIDLIPRDVQKKINNIDHRARQNLKKKTVEVLWGRLMNASSYESWREVHEPLVREYFECADYISMNLRDGGMLVGRMRGQFETVFSDAYNRLTENRFMEMTREQFVDEVVQSIIDEIPDEDEVRAKYGFETSFYDAPMSDEIAEAEERASKVRRDTMLSEDAISEEKRAILRQMRFNVEAQADRRKKEVEATFAKVEDDFYKGLAESLENVSDYMKQNGRMSGRIGAQLKNACEYVRNMNILGDESLDGEIDDIEAYLEERSKAVSDDSKELAMTRLQDALESTRNYVSSRLAALPTIRGSRIVDDTTEIESTDRRVIQRVESTGTMDVDEVQQIRRNVADPVGA